MNLATHINRQRMQAGGKVVLITTTPPFCSRDIHGAQHVTPEKHEFWLPSGERIANACWVRPGVSRAAVARVVAAACAFALLDVAVTLFFFPIALAARALVWAGHAVHEALGWVGVFDLDGFDAAFRTHRNLFGAKKNTPRLGWLLRGNAAKSGIELAAKED